MAFEAKKAMRRRAREHADHIFPWRDIFKGRMIDVGCGPDKIPFADCIGFDQADGDANKLSSYFEAKSFDLIHGSHVLEHMHDPRAALSDWLKLLKPGGYIVQTVPDIGAYENFTYPSRYNPDHKSSWSMVYRGSCFPIHIHIPSFLDGFKDAAEIMLARYVEVNYDWKRREVDQTWREEDGVEIWNEFVLQKIVPPHWSPMPPVE